MRKVMIIGIMAAWVESAWALSYMGPPTSQGMLHHYKFGVDYTDGRMSVDLSGNRSGFKPGDLKTDLIMARLEYGIHEDVDVYARLGFGEIENLGYDLAWGLGIKSTVKESGNLTWGWLAQGTSTSGSTSRLDLDILEVQAAAGPVWKVNETLELYGGPFLHWINGEMKVLGAGGRTYSSDIKQESLFGIYVGIAAWVTNQGELYLEYQKTPDADAYGAGLMWHF